MKQKIVLIILAVSACFIVACSNSSTSSSNGSSSEEGGQQGPIVGPSTCYMGEKSEDRACVKLKTINAANEGYLNPFTDPSFMSSANKEQYRRPVQGVDLEATSPNLKIAPNFGLSEFMALEKGTFGIFSTAIVKKIQELRSKTGGALKINSAFRSPKWNDTIDGSAKWSRHQYGDAVDIASSTASLDKLVKVCRDLGATYVDKYVAHVHCDWRNTKVEPAFFGAVATTRESSISDAELSMNIIQNLTDTSLIHVSGELKAGNIILLTSDVTYKEDTEDLYKKWVITAPNGDQIVREESSVSLPVQRGTYQIEHTIGENVNLSKTIFVN